MSRLVLFVAGILALMAIAPARADDQQKTAGRSVREFLTPSGHFDLEAARRSGYQGPLDMKGFESTFDSTTGQPMFRPSAMYGPSNDPDDIYWDNSISPSVPGVDGDVYATTIYDGKLVVGGNFSVAGRVIANNIAAWDGSSWSPLGSGMGGDYPYVNALTVYDGELVAGGWFTTAGGAVVNGIASWDGSSWSPLGSGMGGDYPYVNALTVYDGKLIAGGEFTTAGGVAASKIASWDGSSWLSLGSGMNGYYVYALTVYDGKLMAGGEFTTAGGVAASKIASWDGSNWSPLASEVDGAVRALIVIDGKLIAGGNFVTVGGMAASKIASWDGSSWSPLGSGMGGELYPNPDVLALTYYEGKLIAGGYFTTAGGVAANYIASWDGSSWSPLGSGTGSYVSSLTVYDGKLIAGGVFTTAGGVAASKIASWDGSSWSSLGSGMNGYYVSALTVYDGKLIAGGDFSTAGGVAANYIASWDGSSWSPLGAGLGGATYPYVSALTVYDGKLIAGGDFSTAGGVAANYIASWDGSSWSPLGSGMVGDYPRVLDLTVYDGKLIAGGQFTTAGGVAASKIASWDGSSWSSLGSGMNGYNVSALTVYDGKLIAGGVFAMAGGVAAHCIASWDGSSWSPLGSGMSSYYVYALTIYDGKLIAGGSFATAGGVAASKIASWDGSSWSPLGSGIGITNPLVSALTVYDGKLIAGGDFSTAGGVAANYIASWDGSSWSPLGSGMVGDYPCVLDLTVYDGKLIAGGYFTIAGNKVSAYLARWTKGVTADVSGFVFDKFSGAAMEGVTVEFWQNDILRYTAVTASSGLYELTGINASSYTIKINKDEYHPFERAEYISGGWQILAGIDLYSTAHYRSTAALKAALTNFRETYYDYLSGAGDCVVEALAYQYGLLHLPEFAAGKGMWRQILENYQAPTAEGLAAILKNHEIGTATDNAGDLLYWSYLESEINETRQTYLSSLQNNEIPDHGFFDKRLIELRERPGGQRMKTINELLAEMDQGDIDNLPLYVPFSFPLEAIVDNLNSLSATVNKATTFDINTPPNVQGNIYRWLPGQCNLSANTFTTVGSMGMSLRSIKRNFNSSIAAEKRQEQVTALCDASSLANTTLSTTNTLLEKGGESFGGKVWAAVGIGCDLGLFLSDVLNTLGETSLAINLNTFSATWPGYFAENFRFYEQTIADISAAIENPDNYNCSRNFNVGSSSFPGGCIPSGQNHVQVQGTVNLTNTDATKSGSAFLYCDIYKVTTFFGERRTRIGRFIGPQFSLGPGQQEVISVNYTLPKTNLFLCPVSFEIYPWLMTSFGQIPLPPREVGTLPENICLTQQAVREIKNLGHEVVSQGQELVTGFTAGAGVIFGKISGIWPGSDMDLHVYDISGNHVGMNYITGFFENQIPGAVFVTDSLHEEDIWVPLNPGDSFTVKIVARQVVDSEYVSVDLTETYATAPLMMVSPEAIADRVNPGDTAKAVFTVFDYSGQNAINLDSCMLSDLVDSAGHIMAANSFNISFPSIIDPESTGLVIVSRPIGEDIAYGEYQGTMIEYSNAGVDTLAVLVEVLPEYICGDANGDEKITVGDAVYIVSYIFRGGPAPEPLVAGDANCDGKITVGDAVYLVSYIFRGGPAPCCP